MFKQVMGGVAVVVLLATGCATNIPEVPSISDSGRWINGKVVWHDLVTPDLEGAKSFYGGLFGWSFEDASENYTLVKNDGRLIGGMALLKSSVYSSYWVPLVSVRDVDQAVEATTSAGGERLVTSFNVPGRGRVGVLKDPRGAAFGVVKTTQGDPVDRVPGPNDWMWNEVWTDDVAASGSFYQENFGYDLKEETVVGVKHTLLTTGIVPRVGVVKKSDPKIANTWVAYVRVADIEATLSKARSLGATVLLAPTAEVRNGNVAILADPHGAGFVVQEVSR